MFKVKIKMPHHPELDGRPPYWYERNARDNFKTVAEMNAWLRRMHQIYSISSCQTHHVSA